MVKVTVSYTFGNDDYSVVQKECTLFEALSEISRKALTNLNDIISLKSGTRTITFIFYTGDKGGIYPFFMGTIK